MSAHEGSRWQESEGSKLHSWKAGQALELVRPMAPGGPHLWNVGDRLYVQEATPAVYWIRNGRTGRLGRFERADPSLASMERRSSVGPRLADEAARAQDEADKPKPTPDFIFPKLDLAEGNRLRVTGRAGDGIALWLEDGGGDTWYAGDLVEVQPQGLAPPQQVRLKHLRKGGVTVVTRGFTPMYFEGAPAAGLPESPLLALDEAATRPWHEERDDTLAYLEHQLRRLKQLGNRDGRETALAFCRRLLARIEAGEHEGARARATEPAGQEGSGETE